MTTKLTITNKKSRLFLGASLLALVAIFAPLVMAVDVCGLEYVLIESQDPVDVNCVTGTGDIEVVDSTVNLLAGDVVSIYGAEESTINVFGGAVLDIYGAGESTINVSGGAIGNIWVYDSTANLLAGGAVSNIYGLGESTINVSGGTLTYLSFASTDFVTVYAASAEIDYETITDNEPITLNDANQLEITQTYIKNIGPRTIYFNLIGTYQDETPFIITCALDPDATLALNVPHAAPEIEVFPALLFWDLGDVEVGESRTVLVQIYNVGTADLNVSSVTLTGNTGFTLTGPATPLVIAPNTSIGVDYEVTFTPSADGLASAVVQILSDDEDEPDVKVDLQGVGIIAEVPPTQQIQNILDYFDASVATGTLQGYGPGNSSKNRLRALRNMIESASDLINAGAYALAIDQLEAISKKMDGVSKPQDFVVGEPVAGLNAMVEALIADLTS